MPVETRQMTYCAALMYRAWSTQHPHPKGQTDHAPYSFGQGLEEPSEERRICDPANGPWEETQPFFKDLEPPRDIVVWRHEFAFRPYEPRLIRGLLDAYDPGAGRGLSKSTLSSIAWPLDKAHPGAHYAQHVPQVVSFAYARAQLTHWDIKTRTAPRRHSWCDVARRVLMMDWLRMDLTPPPDEGQRLCASISTPGRREQQGTRPYRMVQSLVTSL